MNSYSSVFEEIEISEDIQESIKFEISNRFVSEIGSYNAETKELKDPPNMFMKKLLLLSRKERLANLQPQNIEKPSDLLARQINRLKTPNSAPSDPIYKTLVDPSLVNKLKVYNTIESIRADTNSDSILAENEILREKVKIIEKQEFIKRQLYKLGSKNIY
jgi:hypothetical protein